MKKIIVGIISFVFIFASFISTKEVFASSVWNGASNDCKTVSIANHTTGDGHEDPCWPLSSLQAEAGDTINVRIYYHNTSTQKATNVRIILDAPIGVVGSTQKFTGRITSEQGSISGSVTAYIPSNQKLSFGSTKWYPNQKSTSSSLLSGQNGREVLSSGLYIGDIASGWSSQGAVVVSFNVSNIVVSNPTGTISASPSSCEIKSGASTCQTNLTWNTQNPVGTSAITKSGSTIATGNSGSKTVSISKGSSTFYLYNNSKQLDSTTVSAYCATGSEWTGSYCKEIVVANPTGTISASPSSCEIKSGASTCQTNLTWNTQNPVGTSAITKSGSTIATGNSGSKTVSISKGSSTFYLYNNSKQLDSTTVSAYCATGSEWTGSYCKEIVVANPTGTISASPSSCEIKSGASTCQTNLTWNTQNPVGTSAITKSGSTIATGNSGSKTVSISKGSSTFYLYNNSKQLDSTTVSAYCATGSEWTGSYCKEISAPVYNCSIKSFSSDATSIYSGDAVTLTWDTENCTSVNISNVGNSLPSSGSRTVYPTKTTTYTITGISSGYSSTTRSVTVNVSNSPSYVCSIVNFNSSHTSSTSGDAVTLTWDTENCTSVNISNVGNSLPSSGSRTVYPTKTTTYTITGISSGYSSTTRSVTVNVSNSPSYVCSIVNFNSSHTSSTSGDAVTLTWDTENCTSVNISNVGNSLPSSGSRTVYPTKTTTYTITGISSGYSSTTRSVTVNVSNSPSYVCSIVNFNSSHTSSTSGDAVTLTWDTENCTSVNISNVGNSLPSSGSRTVYPTKTTTYTITGSSSVGWSTQSRSLTVNVSDLSKYNCAISSFTADDTSIIEGDSATLRWNTTDCDYVRIDEIGNVSRSGSDVVYPIKDTIYRITASNNRNTETRTVKIYVEEEYDNDDDSCYISRFTVNSTSINRGDSARLIWETSGCRYVKITDLGSVSKSGNDYVYPNTNTTYILTAYNNNSDEKSRSVRVYVDDNNYIINPPVVYNTNAVTTIATNVSETSANINGILTTNVNDNNNVYFEYGTSVALGQRTLSKSISNSSNISEYISGLLPNTIYYFRIVSEGNNGVSRGAIAIFKTLGYNTNIQNYTNTTQTRYVYVGGGETVIGSDSPIMLEIENRYEYIGKRDIVDYTVTYKNISKNILKDSVLQVVVPDGITITNASEGTYSNNTHTLTVELGDLNPNEDGVVYLQGYVNSIPDNLAKIVSTAVLVYTSKVGAQENSIAYVLNMPKINDNYLGASAFFSGFWGLGLIGWLILIILILLIVLIVRSLYHKKVYSEEKNG